MPSFVAVGQCPAESPRPCIVHLVLQPMQGIMAQPFVASVKVVRLMHWALGEHGSDRVEGPTRHGHCTHQQAQELLSGMQT